MMPLYEGDVRRCRRCKRRRMDDEPPEVQQYKTCAKCRIIERTKKKLRKPLAEETMRYGMRQFQEQQAQGQNLMHDDIFASEQLLAEFPDLLVPKQPPYLPPYALYKQPLAPQYTSANAMGNQAPQQDPLGYNYLYGPGSAYAPPTLASRPPLAPSGALPVFNSPSLAAPQNSVAAQAGALQNAVGAGQYTAPLAATAAAIAAAAIKRTDPLLGTLQTLNRLQSHYRQYQQKQQGGDRARLAPATHCELCSTGLDPQDSMLAMYRLCRACYSDPYARPNVYLDFNEFLLAVVRDKDMPSVTYILELALYLVELLSNNRTVASEEKFRKVMLDAFSLIYAEPLLGLLAPMQFARTVYNVQEVNGTAPIVSKVSQEYHYTLTPPLRTSYVAQTELASTQIDMTFIAETNLIIMKKTTIKAAPQYAPDVLRTIDEQMRAKGLTFADDPITVYGLLDVAIEKDQFVRDFASLQKQVTAARADETTKTEAVNHSVVQALAGPSEQARTAENAETIGSADPIAPVGALESATALQNGETVQGAEGSLELQQSEQPTDQPANGNSEIVTQNPAQSTDSSETYQAPGTEGESVKDEPAEDQKLGELDPAFAA